MRKYSVPYFFWLILFVAFPMILIGIMAFTNGDMLNFSTFTFSLENFQRFFESTYLRILINSIILASISTLMCFFIGYPTAYILSS